MRSHQRHPVILTRTNKFSNITKTNSVTGQKQIQLGLNLWKRKTLTRTLRGKAILPRSLQKKPLVTRYYLTADTPKRDSMDYPSNSIRNAALFSTLSCPLQKQNRKKNRKRHFHQGNRHTGQPCTFYCLWSIQYSNSIFFHSCTIKL